MASILETLQLISKPLLLSKGSPKIHIDEWTFRMHYRTTTTLLFLFTGLLCLKEYLGDHIKCQYINEDEDDPEIPRKVLETYCFISTTFTVPFERTPQPQHQHHRFSKAHRHLFSLVGGPSYVPGKNEKVHHAYYQWVPFFLFFQALTFYLPHAFWKYYESDRIKHLVQDLNLKRFLLEHSEQAGKCSHTTKLARYFVKSRGENGSWAAAYILAEVGNLFVVLGNMLLTDTFLGNEFSSFGPKVLKFLETDFELRDDPMTKVFPKVTKCNINTFGPSGSIQRLDALCILSSNILNEKIFTFLWFWFVLVAAITIISVLYRAATYVSFGLRLHALGSAKDFPEKPQGKYVLSQIGRADWLLLHFLRLNMDSVTFYQLVRGIHEEMMHK